MKNLFTSLLLFGFIVNTFAQNNALELKKQELENAKSFIS